MNKIFRIVWSQATQSWVVVSELTRAHKKQSSSNVQKRSAVKSSGRFIKYSAVTLTLLSAHSAYAALNQPGTGGDIAVALGDGSNATGGGATVALGAGSKATGGDSFAVGWEATASATRSISIGNRSTANSGNSIALGSNTQARGDGSIAIGVNAKSNNDAEGTIVIGRDAFSEGSGNGYRPNTVVGRGAYTAFGEGGSYRLNASTALGFQAGAGVIVDPDNNRKLVRNNTNADNNAEVLVKAGYGIDDNAPAETKAALQAGSVHDGLVFYRKRHINEGTAIGVESRAVGDQSIAIGGQVVAGDGVVALGGNDSDALRDSKYQVVTDNAVRNTNVSTIDDYNLAYTESTNTVAGQYQNLVGRGMPGSYKSTYGQSGSVVIGMHAHSTTALGTAIGTNSVVRMGAFGATAIGAGSTVQPNAEAAVAIGMGSVANGAYSLAGGTASWAEYGDIALGYQAKASGKDGAIAMGRATNAQGDSSIMIGGANIESASKQSTNYEKANGQTIDKTVTEKINGHDITRKYSFAATTTTPGTVAEAYKELTGRDMNISAIDFANTSNKNGHASTSLGVHSLAKGNLATAIGAGSRADAIGSVALGVGAQATRQNAVAIGTGSTTDFVGTRQLSVNYDSDGNIVSDDSKDIAYTFKWAGGINTSEGDVVSFGSSGAERQLKNVAAGRVAEDSTDAINGSQLNSITKRIAAGFKTSGNVVTDSSGVFTSKKADADSAKKDYETAIRSEDKVQLQVGNNLKLDRNETESEIDVQDDFDKKKTVKKKIKKADFAYSLNPVLTNLTSAEFKGTGTNAPTTKLTNDGVTITPTTTGKSPVSLTENGLNNGGNAITDVAGNLDGAKTNTNAPTTNATKPNNVDGIKNNAATVGDVLQAGWNLQNNDTAKDLVKPYDTVNFVDGDGTTAVVETTADQATSKIKYSVNVGNGLEKNAANQITVKPADSSLVVDAAGVKVNTGTINNVTTGDKAGTVAANTNDDNKVATVGNVVNAINNAAWTATSAKTEAGELGKDATNQLVKAGDKVTFEADKNIKITQDAGKFTFATKDNVTFETVQVGGNQGPKLSKTDEGDLKVSGPNGTDPVKITNVQDGDISANSKDAINGSQFHAVAKNKIKLAGQNGTDAATETDEQELDKKGGIKFTVKSSDGSLLDVAAKGDTITLTPKTGTITTGEDGVPTANTTGGKLVTADQLVTALTEMGWKATSGNEGTGTVTGTATELIKAGNTVTFKAGDNLALKQAGKEFTYSLNPVLTGLTSAEFKDGNSNKVNITPTGITITKPADPVTGTPENTVTLNQNGLNNGGNPITNVTSNLVNYSDPDVNGKAPVRNELRNFDNNTVPNTNAATVGDLRNMGWIVSADKTTGDLTTNAYTDTVKNANEVKFVGEGTAIVSGKTEGNVRTITVKVDDQVSTNNAVTPVVYTKADGTKVYPVKNAQGNIEYHTTPDGKGDGDQKVDDGDVITSVNGPKGTKAPTTLSNVAGNLDGAKKDTQAPTTAHGPVNTTDKNADNYVNPNNAATVGDVLNAGWNLQNNGAARDFVKPYDTVNFINGKGTVAVVETAGDATSSTVKFDVDAGEITADENKAGAVKGPNTTGKTPTELAKNLADAQKAVDDLAKDPSATADAKQKAQDALKTAQDESALLNKVATAQNVADMINASGFTLKTSNVDGGEKVSGDDEVINPGKAVEMIAGKNLTVKQETNGKVTYATKENVSFNTVNVGGDNTYVDENGKPVTKKEDGTYVDENGQPIEEGKVTKLAPVAMKAEKAKPATNNGNEAKDQPTTALNVSSTDGKPTQITGVGSTLNVNPVDTNPNGTATVGNARPNLIDLVGTDAKPVNKNAAATVGDLQNMGWVVSTKDGNGYKDVVKNANQVDFKGGAGISVKGTTTTDGVREITISVKDGEVVKPNQFTAKVNGMDTPVTKVGDQYYNTADIDPKTGNPKANVTPVTPDEGTTPTNEGNGYVTGNKVAAAIQKSGFVVGKQKDALSAADFKDKVEDEKVNPDDELRFADGNNTKVKLATKESIDKDGNKVTTTTVKVDVTGLPVQYTDKNGTPVTKVGDKYFTVDDKGNLTTTEVKPADLTTNMVNPAVAPNAIGGPTALGNVKSNLPSVNDADKNAKDVAGNPIAGKDNKSAPITAKEVADIVNKAGNNAATVSDVLNAGWNLQNNGEAKDFVKPYDTVNFVDGKGTKAVVETTPNGTTSNVKFDIDTGKITNNDDGSVQGPVVTQEMTKALENATNALNSLPANAPASVRKAAEQAVADAANNIANVANKVATAQDVANAINKSGFALTTSANGGEKISGTPEMINPGKKVEMVAGKNMTVKQESNGKVTYATASNVTFDSVQFGDKGPKITNKAGNINVSGPDGKTPTKITGVAPGEISATSTDAVNGSQLHAVASSIGNLNNKINKVGKRGDAGTASALAAANIPQAYTPGKSLVGIAAGNYQGQNGLAVGMSRISDNGKIIIRLSGTANSQGKTGVAAGVGYQW